MHFITRAVIALLAGMGSGVLGFWASWHAIEAITGVYPGLGYGNWVAAGIFVPGVLVSLAVFQVLSRASRPNPA
jgi:hypothetical protein